MKLNNCKEEHIVSIQCVGKCYIFLYTACESDPESVPVNSGGSRLWTTSDGRLPGQEVSYCNSYNYVKMLTHNFDNNSLFKAKMKHCCPLCTC